MKILIVTVAGMSSRFSESLGRPCLKCIYYKESIKESLLYKMLHQNGDFDRYVIVGGFMFDALKVVIEKEFQDFGDKIILVENAHYSDYGSGYSLYLGLAAIQDMDYDEVMFAEGDLFVDTESFKKVCDTPNNVITCNQEAILANKAVAFYYDKNYGIHTFMIQATVHWRSGNLSLAFLIRDRFGSLQMLTVCGSLLQQSVQRNGNQPIWY